MRATPLGFLLTAPALLAAAAVPSGLFTNTIQEEVAFSEHGHELLQRAFWLEEHDGALEEALALYEAAARDEGLDHEARAEARRCAEAIGQDIIASDMTQLMPPDAIAYVEFSEPGENLAALLSQLGVYGNASETGRFGISPELVQGLIGIKGAALGVTGISSNNGLPTGILVLHPGDLDVTRGLLETALPAQGRQRDSIEGYSTWSMPIEQGIEVYVTMTERLFIVSNDIYEIGAVIERMRGDDDDTLANNENLAEALEARHGALLSICLNAEPVLPLVKSLAAQAVQHEPEAAMAMALCDVDSLRSLSAHLTAGEDGLGMEVELELEEGHRNLVFDLLRTPNVHKETLALVPAGAAFALATALNPPARVAPLHADANGRPVVSLLDIGRELFSNVVDCALYGLPADGLEGGMPNVALVMQANDPARTTAMLELVLGLATQASSEGRSQAASETIAGVEARRYDLQGIPIFMASEAGRVIVSPSRAAIALSIDAASGHGSLLTDPLFQREIDAIDGSGALLVLAAPGRLARMASPWVPPSERRQVAPLAQLMESSVFSMCLVHDDTRMGLSAHLRSLPDVSELVARALRGEDPFGAPFAAQGTARSTASSDPRPALGSRSAAGAAGESSSAPAFGLLAGDR